MKEVGVHLIADLAGIAVSGLKDEEGLMRLVGEALSLSGFHVLHAAGHPFPDGGQGVTGFFLLSESHAAFHTYPEFGYMALDLFTCGGGDLAQALSRIVAALEPGDVQTRVIKRGFG